MANAREVPPTAGAALDVVVTRYELVKVRLGQVLLPIALVAFPIARRFGSGLALVPALIPAVAALWAFLSARKSSITRLVAHPGRVKIGSSTVHSGDEGLWRWHGAHATLFAPEGNLVVRATNADATENLRAVLEGALGCPLRFRRCGSLRARSFPCPSRCSDWSCWGLG